MLLPFEGRSDDDEWASSIELTGFFKRHLASKYSLSTISIIIVLSAGIQLIIVAKREVSDR